MYKAPEAAFWLTLLGIAAGPLTAQTSIASALAGVQLQVTETGVDLSRPAAVPLHLQVLNGSQRPFKVSPGAASLVYTGGDGQQGRCENPPDAAEGLVASAKTLRPGDSYSETVLLDADVCEGLRQAKAVVIEVALQTGDANPVTVQSQPVPIRTQTNAADAIRAVLTQQAADWNRGDLDAFAAGYKNSPDILFIGHKISRGYDGMLATYKQAYATREAMGTLTFSQLEVQPLDTQLATVTGQFHLERTASGGGIADGYFLLVFENTVSGWKIVRDDTTATTPPAPTPKS